MTNRSSFHHPTAVPVPNAQETAQSPASDHKARQGMGLPPTAAIVAVDHYDFLPGRLVIERGTFADYRQVARFHYISGKPATIAAVWTATFLPAGRPSRVVGVSVLSWPSAVQRERHEVFGIAKLPFGQRLKFANDNLRNISRVIIHPQFRSIGLAGGLIRTAVAHCPTPFVEASARMGRAHPMFARSGMTPIHPTNPRAPVYYWCRSGASLATTSE